MVVSQLEQQIVRTFYLFFAVIYLVFFTKRPRTTHDRGLYSPHSDIYVYNWKTSSLLSLHTVGGSFRPATQLNRVSPCVDNCPDVLDGRPSIKESTIRTLEPPSSSSQNTNKMPISAELATSIADAVAAGFDDQLAYTQQLIRTGGQRGEEHAVQALVYNRFSSHGYNPIRLEMDPNLLSQHEGAGRISTEHSKAPIVIGVHEPRSQNPHGKSLILNAHIDIVPTGPVDLWTRDPYSGDIEGDKLYGRGGADMRAGSAANLYALDALRRVGVQPASKVILESVVEEESTGNGTLMTHLKGYRADAVIIPEPMDEKLVRANVGVLWFQVEVKGIPVHVRDMGTGTNAIDACWRVVGGLRELEKEWNEKKIGRLHFENENHPLSMLLLFFCSVHWRAAG